MTSERESRKLESAEILEQIRAPLASRENDWRELQNRIAERLRSCTGSRELRGSVYRIYTREERQRDNGIKPPHMKTGIKIAEEIRLNMYGGYKTRWGTRKRVKPNKKFWIYEVLDIIGVTVVCPFESDVQRIVDQINSDAAEGVFALKDEIKSHDRPDYRAVHVHVEIPQVPLKQLVCEIQIKTAIQDAFSWKTHGLAYKADERTGKWFIDQFERVVQVLRSADGISDQLRDRLERELNVSRSKRVNTRRSLASSLLDRLMDIPDEEVDKRDRLQELSVGLDKLLSAAPGVRSDDTIEFLKEQIDVVIDRFGYDEHAFRVAALCAIVEPRGDYINVLDTHYRMWTNKINLDADDESLRSFLIATAIYSLAHYCSNDTERAITVSEAALKRVGAREAPGKARIHGNIAYYYAELYGLTRESPMADKALHHLKRARKIEGQEADLKNRDTFGYVMIETGETVEDVEKGLANCRTAYGDILREYDEGSKMRTTAREFFELHREIAYHRLARLAAESGTRDGEDY